MAESRRRFDQDFKEGAVGRPGDRKPVGRWRGTWALTREPGQLGESGPALRGEGNGALGEDERAELVRLRKENAELAMERVL